MADKPVCKIDGCDKQVVARGWCSKHWQRWRNHGDPMGAPKKPAMRDGVCSIGWCEKPARVRGLCVMHNRRRALGQDMDAPPIAPKRAGMDWILSHVDHEGDDCLIWPYARNQQGYGRVMFNGKSSKASRVMCILAHGDPKDGKMDAAHSCGNGHLGCVNPRHLRWATRAENHADRKRHGTFHEGERHPAATVNEDCVREIRKLKGTATHAEIAGALGVSVSIVGKVLRRERWTHIS